VDIPHALRGLPWNEYQIARGNESLSSRPIQERIRTVISDEQFLRRLKPRSSEIHC
jgi:hypothetical protein